MKIGSTTTLQGILNRLGVKIAAVVAAGLVGAAVPSFACTSFLITNNEGKPLYGRTMEFAFLLSSQATVVPRQYAYQATGPDGKPGMKWKSKYAAMGLNAFDMPYIIDGMNEKGLTGGILYFPGFADYADPKTADPAKTVAPWEFLTWLLTNYATVAEVKQAVADGVFIFGAKMPDLDIVPPFHYTIHDATGASVVIEPLGGKLKVWDNPIGVMTNSPPFDWHMINLNNYLKLSPYDAPPLDIRGMKLNGFGQGTGWLGIPGDPTPPSRLIRATAFSMTSYPVAPGDESVRLVEHIVNNFDIPKGSIRTAKGDKADPDFTQWSTVADIARGRYYVKTYNNQRLKGMAFASFDLDAKEIVKAPLEPDLTPGDLFPKK